MYPTDAEINFVANVLRKSEWGKVPDSWVCPACHRGKRQTVRKSNKGIWFFELANRVFYDENEPNKGKRAIVCKDCGVLASNLGKEACLTALVTVDPGGYGRYVSVEDILTVVLAQPHGKHNIENTNASALIEAIVERLEYFSSMRN